MADDPKNPSSSNPQGAPAQQQMQLHIEDSVAQGVYANMAVVHHNETEFVLDFLYVLPQIPKAVVRSRVITSPKHLKRLVLALQDNLTRYEAQFGRLEASGPTLPPMH
jgi:hypothetical protein